MRKALTIIGKSLLGILAAIYVVVALANYSVVQSLAGSIASNKLSEEWGGTVRIGSMGLNLLGRATLHDVLLISPRNDTIANLGRVTARYSRNPIQADGLHLSRVFVSRSYFHLQQAEDLTIVQFADFLAKRFASTSETDDTVSHPFVVYIDQVTARHIRYKQTLTSTSNMRSAKIIGQYPIDIPNLNFTDINFKCRNLRVDGARVTVRIERFDAQEASGMNVRSLKTNVYVAPDGISATDLELATDSSRVLGDVLLKYDRFESFLHFFDSVDFCVNIKEGTTCNMQDAAYWGHVLWGMNEQIAVSGSVFGPMGNFHVNNMALRLGNDTYLDFDGSMKGLPEIENTTIAANIKTLQTSYADLASVKWGKGVNVVFPPILQKLDKIDATAAFSGGLRNCHAAFVAQTTPGELVADATLLYDNAQHAYTYEAQLSSPNFMVAHIAENDWVTHTGFVVNAQGAGFDPRTLHANVSGHLANSALRGIAVDVTTFEAHADNGTISANVSINDSLINGVLWASANLGDSIKDYEVSASLHHLDLKKLRLWQRDGDTSAQLSTQLQAHLTGNDLESLYGTAVVDNTNLVLNNSPVKIRSTALSVRNASNYKNISLISDIVNARINGYFGYKDIPLIVQRFCQQYLPRYYAPKPKPDSLFIPLDNDYINFDVTWLDTVDAMAPLMKNVMLAPGTELHGTYNYAEQLKIVLRSDSVALSSVTFHDIGLNANKLGEKYSMDLSSQRIALNTSTLQENVEIVATTSNDAFDMHWMWDNLARNDKAKNSGDIAITMQSDDSSNIVNVGHSLVNIGKDSWRLFSVSPIIFHDSTLKMDELLLFCADQSLKIHAQRNSDSSDVALLDFTNFKLAQFAPLLVSTGLTVGGTMNGNVKIMDWARTPYISADINIGSTTLSGQPLGKARIRSNWDPVEKKKVDLLLTTALNSKEGTIAPITANGTINFINKNKTGLDFEVLFEKFNLQTLQPMAKSFASELAGNLRGRFFIGGTIQEPAVRGTAYFEDGAAKLAKTGVRYTFNDSIAFNENNIVFSNFAMHDPSNGTAFINGNISHDHLHEIALNLTLRSNKMTLLSTTSKDGSYYGIVNAEIDGRVKGSLDNIDINVKARTLSGSHVVALIDQQKQVEEAGYIQFVQPAQNVSANRRVRKEETSNSQYNVTVDLDVTPDLHLSFPIDYSQVGAQVEATGHGELELTMNNASPLSLIGDYVFNGGTMEVSLLGVLSKKFAIEEGSVITFPGNIDGAMFDITALYTQRVNLSTLTGSLSTDNSQQMVEVQNVIAVNGTIDDPSVNFDLRLPNADQSLQEEIFSYIDRTSERDMLNQTFSLLLMKSFYSTNSGIAQSSTPGGSSLLANSLGSVVSDMVEFADINFDVTSGTDITTDQVLMNVNKSWDKVYFESTFGFGGEARNVRSVNTGNNLIGDMLLGYKINPRLHVYVFNRSNTNDYTRSDLPFKQGVGVKYSHDFDRWKDLFKKKLQKKETK